MAGFLFGDVRRAKIAWSGFIPPPVSSSKSDSSEINISAANVL
jgi:hypothetical protein